MGVFKIKSKSNGNSKDKDSSAPWSEEDSVGTIEQIANQNYLTDQLAKAKREGVLERYCEMLHTQIGSLATKVLNLHDQIINEEVDKSIETADQTIHLEKLRKYINAAKNELDQAQIYARDNIDKE